VWVVSTNVMNVVHNDGWMPSAYFQGHGPTSNDTLEISWLLDEVVG
jgi:hypothetical protein